MSHIDLAQLSLKFLSLFEGSVFVSVRWCFRETESNGLLERRRARCGDQRGGLYLLNEDDSAIYLEQNQLVIRWIIVGQHRLCGATRRLWKTKDGLLWLWTWRTISREAGRLPEF